MNTDPVLFIGDINVDILMGGLESMPVKDREITCRTFEVAMGSSAAIAACTYASLGGPSAILGLAGRDDYGDFMLAGLHEFRVNTDRVQRTDAVRTGVTVNLIRGRTRSQVTYPGTIAAFDGTGLDGTVFRGTRHAHFAGPYQQTRFRPELARLLRSARDHGLSTSLDPQWDSTETWAHMQDWLPLLDYLFLNEDEAVSITGAPDAAAACRQLAAATACPIVKTGRRGALFCQDGNPVAVPTYRTEVVDTTGAGDALAAGALFAKLEQGLSLQPALAFGNAVAARSCAAKGGVAARSSCATIRQFMKDTEYERV